MKNIKISLLIVLASFLFVAVISYKLSTDFLDKNVNDYFVKQHTYKNNMVGSDDIALIIIDEKSIEKLRWPWARTYYTDIFEYLQNISDAKVIAFDAVITSPDSYNPKADTLFYKRLHKLPSLIAGFNLYTTDNNSGDLLPQSYDKVFDTKNTIKIKDKRHKKIKSNYKGVIKFPKEYIESVSSLGSVMVPIDNDGLIRRYIPIVEYKNQLYPSLALSAFAKKSGITDYILYDNFLCSNDNCKTLRMPVSQSESKNSLYGGASGIFANTVWYKPKNEYYSHNSYSAIDIIESYKLIREGKKPIIDPKVFKNKIVFIGGNSDSQSLADRGYTPVLIKHSGVDIQATAMNNMLDNRFFIPKNQWITVVQTILFAILSFLIIKNFSIILSIGLITLLVCAHIIFYNFLLLNYIEISLFAPIIMSLVVIAFGYSYKFIIEGENKEKIQTVMGKYISQDIMKNVIKNIDNVEVGGLKSEVTIMFADIRNFTTISENLSAEEVTGILNEYISAIEPIIRKHDGIINKFIGDAIMAIFGEPIRNKKHAINAVKCASQILKKAKYLQEKWLSEGKPKISIGIGINTGEVFAGNIGSENRLEYTVIGDAVNLASRIESHNKIYKTQFLISENTYKHINNIADVIKISNVTIRGKQKKIDIYEVLRIIE